MTSLRRSSVRACASPRARVAVPYTRRERTCCSSKRSLEPERSTDAGDYPRESLTGRGPTGWGSEDFEERWKLRRVPQFRRGRACGDLGLHARSAPVAGSIIRRYSRAGGRSGGRRCASKRSYAAASGRSPRRLGTAVERGTVELNDELDGLAVDIGQRPTSTPVPARRAIIVVGPHRSGTSAL